MLIATPLTNIRTSTLPAASFRPLLAAFNPPTDTGGRFELTTIENARLLPGIAGDYNGNGTVDAVDYAVWRDTLAQIGGGLAADGNANGTVDAGDFDVWRARFGQTAPAVAAARATNAAPEPAALMLVMAAGAWATLLRRR